MKETLLDITEMVHSLLREIEAAEELGIDTEDEQRLLRGYMDKLVIKTKNIDMFIDQLENIHKEALSWASSYQDLSSSYREKAKSIDNTKKKLLSMFHITGLVTKGNPYRTGLRSYSLKETESVELDEELNIEEIPEEFVRIKKEFNKSKMKDFLKEGGELPGVSLKTTSTITRR